jgi:hypothetical protein
VGKKNKLNKIDIVGSFLKRKTRKGDLGLIEVKILSLCGRKFNKVKDLLHNIQDEKNESKSLKSSS